MTSPQSDKPRKTYPRGAVMVPKPLWDALEYSPMGAPHKAVVRAVLRRTIGHYEGTRPNDAAAVSVATIVGMTRLHRVTVSRARQDLIDAGVLVVVVEATWFGAAVIYVNQDPTTWGPYSVNPAVVDWEAAVDCYQPAATKGAAGSDKGGSHERQKGAVDGCPLNTGSLFEGKNGRAPADDTGGSSGTGRDDSATNAEACHLSNLIQQARACGRTAEAADLQAQLDALAERTVRHD
jgi:hypothetical protein